MAIRGLWCHHPKNMNDLFECLGMLDRPFNSDKLRDFREYAEKSHHSVLHAMKNCSDQELVIRLNKIRKGIIERFAFCSLSETFDDILMWSHYSSAHTGVVIGLEFPELSEDHHLQKVSYVNSLPSFDLIILAKFVEGEDRYLNYFFKDISIKSSDWCKEKEWRIWRKSPMYYFYKPENVKEIYFGVSCTKDTRKVILDLTSYLGDTFLYHNMVFKEEPVRLERE